MRTDHSPAGITIPASLPRLGDLPWTGWGYYCLSASWGGPLAPSPAAAEQALGRELAELAPPELDPEGRARWIQRGLIEWADPPILIQVRARTEADAWLAACAMGGQHPDEAAWRAWRTTWPLRRGQDDPLLARVIR